MKWAEHVVRAGEMRNVNETSVEKKLKGKVHSADLVKDGRIILKSVLGKQCVKLWTGHIWSGPCETVINLQVPYNEGKGTISFSRRSLLLGVGYI
jgi:hypothetical protein